ncbi:patched family protein [Teladorsagia circumcincta]|uniref:Patched family protein n=1 Tax=Teladorsagia circumcincta TaxID=45464 RepID=A0A2G9UEA9_TELCI|nr:patched family protein [Teladorsagia circumcincta]
MQYIELRDSIREGYTALQARSRYETQALREFMNTSGCKSQYSAGFAHEVPFAVDPMEMIVLLMAKDGGSVHRKAHLDEAATIVDFIYNMTVTHENRSLVYKKMCSPYCFANELFGTFKHYYDVNYRSATKSGTWSDLFNLSYPFASIWGYRVPLEQCLFGVVLTKPSKTSSSADTKKVKRFIFDEEIPVDRSKPLESQITNMEYVRLIVLFPYGFKNTTELQTGFALWELGIHEWTKKYNKGLIKKDSKIEVLAYGNEILDMEVNEDNRKMAPFFGIGFASMLAMVVICVLSISYYYEALDVGKILIGVCATLCPLLGITSTYGLLALFGVRVNSLLLVMPFLIMGVGVDALFLMMYSWQKMMEYNYTPSGRLGMVFEECGPSITITSVTNVLAFGIGAITPTPGWSNCFLALASPGRAGRWPISSTVTSRVPISPNSSADFPEVRLFCVGSSIAIFLTYIYQLILFGPALAIATTYERPYRFGDENKGTGCRALINVVFLTLLRTHCAILSRAEVAVVVFIMTVIYLCLGIQGLMTMNVRLDSEKILPRDSELHRPNTLLMNYVWEEHLSPIFLVNNRFNLTNTNLTDQFWDVLKELETLPLCKGTMQDRAFKRSIPALQLDDETVERFLFMVAYTNVTNWDVRIELMTQWRNVIAKYGTS